MKFKLKHWITLISITAGITAYGYIYQSSPSLSISPYPDGKNFAFTIVDDPDGTKLNETNPVYDFLDSIGFRTTIACWVYKPVDVSGLPDQKEQLESDTLENDAYLEFIKKYKQKGFEIALHTVTAGNDNRETTREGYEKFKEIFLEYPKINIMHSKNRENIYWGENVFTNLLLKLAVGLYDRVSYGGEDPDSPYFWGDICKNKTSYIRLWGTSDINTLKFNPSMPYHDVNKPFVNYWFSFSDGYNVYFFNKLLSAANVKKLVKERGICIVYTHFAAGFCKKNPNNGMYILNSDTKRELSYLSRQKEGWFAPVSDILDRLLEIKNISVAQKGRSVVIYNRNRYIIKGVTFIVRPFMKYEDELGKKLTASEEGEIIIGDFQPKEKKVIYIADNLRLIKLPQAPDFLEYVNLVWQRVKILLLEHRG
jgi:hypothetical protein